MRVGELPPADWSAALERGVRVRIGPACIEIRSPVDELGTQLHRLYSDYPLAREEFADIDVAMVPTPGLRRMLRSQVTLVAEGTEWFVPFPRSHALPMLEWGINWHFAKRMHRFLILHAGAAARGDRAVLLPAWPGSGKSTLSAALALSGWRFFSDEFGLVQPGDGRVVPFPRLVPLKNESIEVIRKFSADAVLGPVFPKTRKGDVAHFRPPAESIHRAGETAEVAAVVFPNFERGAKLELLPIARPAAFLKLAGNAFNYEILGETGFHTVSRLIRHSRCAILRYGDLADAVRALEELVA